MGSGRGGGAGPGPGCAARGGAAGLNPRGVLVVWQLGRSLHAELPLKVGSFQLFVRGFKDAAVVLRRLDLAALSPPARASLQLQFEAMVALDYITRNTDRGNDNWLLRHERAGMPQSRLIHSRNGHADAHSPSHRNHTRHVR